MDLSTMVLDEMIAAIEAWWTAEGTDAEIHLFTDDFGVFDPTRAIGEYTLVNGNGITNLPATKGSGETYLNGRVNFPFDGVLFQLTSDPDPAITVYGFLITDDGATKVLGGGLFDDPVVLAVTGDYVHVDPVLRVWIQSGVV